MKIVPLSTRDNLEDIYSYWFAQFDFHDTTGQPYKAAGGAMLWNEKLKRYIPSGWDVKPLGELCSFRNGINYNKSAAGDKTYRIINVRNISSYDAFHYRELYRAC